jgi:hypothetical protein
MVFKQNKKKEEVDLLGQLETWAIRALFPPLNHLNENNCVICK